MRTTVYYSSPACFHPRSVDLLKSDTTLVIHAGKTYYEPLLSLLANDSISIEIPTEGLQIGDVQQSLMSTDITNADGLDLSWSDWHALDPTDNELSTIPTNAGLYRIHHHHRPGLEYIGQTGRSLRGRIGALARNTYKEEMPYRDPHTAAPCLWAIRQEDGPAFSVSYAVPPIADSDRKRKGLEAALIALYRKETGESPTANFGRIIPGYQQSSYRHAGIIGGPLTDEQTEPNAERGVEPPIWHNWENPRAQDWMHLEWSDAYRLEQRLDAAPPNNGLYRIWYEHRDTRLAYIGESSAIPSRLYDHEKTFGSQALFTYAERIDLDAAHKRQEIETDLLGAYYLAISESPAAQFGHVENIPPLEADE